MSSVSLQPLPLYPNPTLRGDLWDLTWLNHIIVLYCPTAKSELHTRFISLFKMAAYAALCNKAIADDYYNKMDAEIKKVKKDQGKESPLAARLYYQNYTENSIKMELKELESFEESLVPNYGDVSNLLNEAPVVVPTIPPVAQGASLSIGGTPLEKLWARYRVHSDQKGVAAMPSFRLFIQGTLARERGLTDLVASIVCAGWSSGVRADNLPILECGVSEQTWAVFRPYHRVLSTPGAFTKLPLLMQTLILESALAKTARRLFDLKAKTQVGSWLDWYDLLKGGPVVVRATIGDRYIKRKFALPTTEVWNGEVVLFYPTTAVRLDDYRTQNPSQEAHVVIAANSLILVGGKTIRTEREEYGESLIYFRLKQNGALFRVSWKEFSQNLVSFDGLLYSSTPKGKQSAKPAVWAIYSK